MKLRYKEQMIKLSDEELMELIIKGDRSAFEQIYERYSKVMVNYFNKMFFYDIEKAQDFLQDLFLKIIDKPERYNPTKKFSTWVFSVAYNMCKNEFRNRAKSDDILKNEFESNSVNVLIEDEEDLDLLKTNLKSEIENLNDESRSILILRCYRGFSMKEISDVIGCPVGTVKSRIFYSLKLLNNKLKMYHNS